MPSSIAYARYFQPESVVFVELHHVDPLRPHLLLEVLVCIQRNISKGDLIGSLFRSLDLADN